MIGAPIMLMMVWIRQRQTLQELYNHFVVTYQKPLKPGTPVLDHDGSARKHHGLLMACSRHVPTLVFPWGKVHFPKHGSTRLLQPPGMDEKPQWIGDTSIIQFQWICTWYVPNVFNNCNDTQCKYTYYNNHPHLSSTITTVSPWWVVMLKVTNDTESIIISPITTIAG